jgi:hypothetical protein
MAIGGFTVIDSSGAIKTILAGGGGAPDVSTATGTLAILHGGTGDTTAAGARTSLGLAIGTDIEAHDADLDALAGVSSNGLLTRTGAGTASARTITAGANISVANGDGVAGNPTVAVTGIGSTIQAFDADLDAVAAISANGFIAHTGAGTAAARTITAGTNIGVTNGDGVSGNPTVAFSGTLPVASGGTGATTASGARTNLGLVIGTDVEAHDADLTAIAALASTGFAARTASDTWAQRALAAGANISIANPAGVAGDPSIAVTGIGSTIQAFDADLDALAALSTTGLVARTAAATYVPRTITAGTGISIANGNGVSGNPTISVGPTEFTTTTTGNIDDLNFSNANLIRMNNATLSTIRGLVAGTAGQMVTIVSIGAGQVDLSNQDAADGTAANRLKNTVAGIKTSLSPGLGFATYQYDGTTARWRLVSHTQGAMIAYTSIWAGFTTNPVLGNGTQLAQYLLRGTMVLVGINITAGTTTTFGTGFWTHTVPIAPSGAAPQFALSGVAIDVSTGINYGISVSYTGAGGTGLFGLVNATSANVTNLAPMTWANTDIYRIALEYMID